VLEVRKKPNGTESWFIGGHEVAMVGPAVIDKDMRRHYNVYSVPTFADIAPAASSPRERLEFMDKFGVKAQVIYPNVIGFGAHKMMGIAPDDVELRLWHVQAYNDALVDLKNDGQGRLFPMAALPLWDIDASLKEIERIRKNGLTGVALSDAPAHFGQPPLAHPAWDPLFATCQDLDLPINFHIGSGSFEGDFTPKWWGTDKTIINSDGTLQGPISAWAASLAQLNNFVDIANLVLSGICEKFPKLKFVSVESGCGWIPSAIQAIEHNWNEFKSPADRKRIKREPKEIFKDQIFVPYFFEGRNCVDAFLKEFGNDNLLFETDFPHPSSISEDVRERIEQTLGHWDLETQHKVLYKNAERLYGKVGGIQTH